LDPREAIRFNEVDDEINHTNEIISFGGRSEIEKEGTREEIVALEALYPLGLLMLF